MAKRRPYRIAWSHLYQGWRVTYTTFGGALHDLGVFKSAGSACSYVAVHHRRGAPV